MIVVGIDSRMTLRQRMVAVWEHVNRVIDAGAIEIIIQKVSKTRAQEKLYHALIADIASAVIIDGQRYDRDCWKALLVDQFTQEMQQAGTPLTRPGRMVISLDGLRVVTVRASTTQFRKHEAAEFVEFLHAFGAERGVVFRDQTAQQYSEYREAA